MEQNFQTSFIPKTPMIEQKTAGFKSIGLLTIISVFIFFTMLVATVSLYFYDGILAKNLVNMENNLNLAKNRFEPSKIIQLQTLDKRLNAANTILSQHIAVSPVFKVLQEITMKTVGYNRFSYHLNDSGNDMLKININGMAVDYKSIALQSDLFAKNKNFIDPVFSDLSLDNTGKVLFSLEFSVDSNLVNYKQALKVATENNSDTASFSEEEILD